MIVVIPFFRLHVNKFLIPICCIFACIVVFTYMLPITYVVFTLGNLSSMTIHSCMMKVWLNHRFTAIAFVFYSNNAANNHIRQN